LIDPFGSAQAAHRRLPSWRAFRLGWVLALLVIFVFSAGCLPAAVSPSPTSPGVTPTPQTTAQGAPTATIDWFPSTDIPVPSPLPQVSPTPAIFPVLGAVAFEETFEDPELWERTSGPRGSAALGPNELTIVLNEPGAYIASTRREPYLADFYLEVTARANLCAGLDEYGLLLRVASAADFYRFSLSCDGRMRLDQIRGGTAASPLTWTPSAAVPRNAPAATRIGAWADGEQMHFYLNGTFQVSVNTPMIPGGQIGFFARSGGQNAVTVNFSDLTVWEVLP
jgi:hypothetical protein